jgi:urease accessory protein
MTTTTPIRTKRKDQRGSLWLSFEPKDNRTVLAGWYTSSPFGAVRANYPDGSGIPEVQITNPSGGILGGDSLELEISLAPGSSATILTQAANKAYRGETSEQRALFRVGEGAFLEYLPHHLIPYSGSDYRQVTTFQLAPDSTLITWDAYAAGRVARSERFYFTGLYSRTRISRYGIPEVVDGFELTGGTEWFGGYPYTAAIYILAPRNLESLAKTLLDLLAVAPGALASSSALSSGICAIRALANDAHTLYRLLNRSRDLARRSLKRPVPAREIT